MKALSHAFHLHKLSSLLVPAGDKLCPHEEAFFLGTIDQEMGEKSKGIASVVRVFGSLSSKILEKRKKKQKRLYLK